MKTGLYLHFPFCREKCDYCSFRSFPVSLFQTGNGDVVDNYLRRLRREISWWSGKTGDLEADTIYFGGGTPSLLEPDEIHGIIGSLRENFRIDDDPEITIEVNPADADEKRIAGYRDAGVGRIVLGVQTLNWRLHRIIGRCGNPAERDLLEEFFSVRGITHSLDLIAGIPGQKREELLEEIELLTSYSPKHISLYLLTLDEKTPLYKRMTVDESFPELQREHFDTAIRSLKEKGYIHYEISNFSLEGFRSRHNMKYWTFQPYIGFGPGAHSFIRNRRYINRMTVEEYLESADLTLEEDVRGGYAPLVEYILTGLRLIEGFSPERMKKLTGLELPEKVVEKFQKLESEGLIRQEKRRDENIIKLTERGIPLADAVTYEAVEPLL